MKVVIQGLGFVGAAMATAIASKSNDNQKFEVIGIDLQNDLGNIRINSINMGEFPFKTNDKKLVSELKKSVEKGFLKATSDSSVYENADVVIVSVNCDLIEHNNNKLIDLEGFKKSIGEISNKVGEETLIIVETTVPPGTCERIVFPIFEDAFKSRNLDITKLYLAHSYERVMPGKNYLDSIINFWRVYSGINEESAFQCKTFLEMIVNTKEYPLRKLKNTTASETAKVLENSYRALNIAFMEEWGRFSEDVGIDIFEIVEAVRQRPTHSNIMQPGFGVGGYCLTKDPLFAKIAARDIFKIHGHSFTFSTQSVEINSKMPEVTLKKIEEYLNGNIKGKTLLLLGATYRQDIGDTRFSPSEYFAKGVLAKNCKLTVCDPLIEFWDEMKMEIKSVVPNLSNFDVVVFAVQHKEFSKIDFSDLSPSDNTLIFDANNVLTKTQVEYLKSNKLNYASIGRG